MAGRINRAWVTGGRGFTGAVLRDALAQNGVETISLVREAPEAPGEVQIELGDRARVEALARQTMPDVVFHLAAVSFVAHGDATELYASNVVAADHLLAALADSGVALTRVLLASSANVYGDPGHEGPVAEDAALQPVNHYGCSKAAMEYIAATYANRLPVLCVRPFNYTGHGQDEKFLVPKIVKAFAERRPEIELGNLDVVRDFSDVRDVVAAYLALAATSTPHRVINLCSGRGVALREVVSMLEALTGYRIDIRVNPAFIRSTDIKTLIGDPGRLRQSVPDLHWRPFEFTLRDMVHAVAGNPAAPGAI